MRSRLPAAVRGRRGLWIQSHHRSFAQQAGITRRALARQPGFRPGSADPQIAQAIRNVMQTISMPGFSRHHWGTEIDVVDPTRSRWTGSGDLVPLIPFLRAHAHRFGFFHPYTQSPPDPNLPHYQDEPWHLSYGSIANVLQRQWQQRITGQVLTNLIQATARAVRGRIPQTQMERVLGTMGLQHFQTNVAPSP